MHWLRRISWKIKSGQGNRTIIELSIYAKIKSHRLLMTNYLKNSKSLTFGMRGNTWPNPIQNNQIQFFSLTTLNMPKMEIIHLFFIELLVIIAVSHLNGQEHFGYNWVHFGYISGTIVLLKLLFYFCYFLMTKFSEKSGKVFLPVSTFLGMSDKLIKYSSLSVFLSNMVDHFSKLKWSMHSFLGYFQSKNE